METISWLFSGIDWTNWALTMLGVAAGLAIAMTWGKK